MSKLFTLTEVERRSLPGYKPAISIMKKDEDEEDKNMFQEH